MGKAKHLITMLILALCIGLFIPSIPVKAATLKLKEQKKVLLVGSTYVLHTNTKKKVSWTSNHPGIASVAKNGKIIAKKPGKAVITAKVGKQKASCAVTVKGTVDILVFAGQSNMTGNGDAKGAPALLEGAGVAYNPVTNKKNFDPIKEPFGRGQDDSFFQNYSYANGSMVTAFVNSYYQQTKTPVIAVSASCVGTGSVSWVESRYQGVINRTKAATKLAKSKGLTVRHVFLVWMQGENDAFARMPRDEHKRNIANMFSKIKSKTKMEYCFLLTIPSYYYGSIQYFPSKDLEVDLGFDIGYEYTKLQNAEIDLCNKNRYFYLVSTKASSLPASYLRRDGLHLTQEGLNLVGRDAGTNAGKIVKKMK